MCMNNVLRRFGAFVAALVLCFALCVPALAADNSNPSVSAELTWSARFYNSLTGGPSQVFHPQKSVSAPFYGSNSAFDTVSGSLTSPIKRVYCYPRRFELSSVDWFSGSIGLYVSFYAVAGDGNLDGSWDEPIPSSFYQFFYIDHLGSEHFSDLTIENFTPAVSGSSVSPGYTIKASILAEQASPVSAIGFSQKIADNAFNRFVPSKDISSFSVSFVFPSCTIVVTSSSDELSALENMADSIVQQNQILSQFYGDVIQVCNQIFQRLGNLQAAQEEANRLFSNVISLLNTTNGKLEAINMAMSTYFELLINQLKQEGIDTRTAIADAEARLEAYLKPMIDYFNELQEQTGESAATLPGHKTDIDGFNNQGFGIDSDGQAGVAALVPILSAFGWIWSIIALFIGVGLIHILVKKGIG